MTFVPKELICDISQNINFNVSDQQNNNEIKWAITFNQFPEILKLPYR